MVLRLALILHIQVDHEILNQSIETSFPELSFLSFPLVHTRKCWGDALHWGTTTFFRILSASLFTNCIFTAVHSEQFTGFFRQSNKPCKDIHVKFFKPHPPAEIINEKMY